MYFVYILKSLKDGKLYTGCTDDVERRLVEHNSGKSTATRNRRPLVLVHSESFESKSDALKREYFLKTKKGSFEKYQIWQQYEMRQNDVKS
jgi:putative endonuclease